MNNNVTQDKQNKASLTNLNEKMDEKWRMIVTESARESGINPDCNIDNLPSWIDKEELKEAQEVVRQYKIW